MPYNIERLLFYLADEDGAKVKKWMEAVEHGEAVKFDEVFNIP